MPPTATTPRQPRLIQVSQSAGLAVRDEIVASLSAASASIAPKFFYDPLGSRLFDAITELPEYYPTRTEAQIFARHADEIAAGAGRGRTLVDLGAGNCEKAGRLFAALQPRRYVAVDISIEFLRHALRCLQREHPQMDMIGVGLDFSRELVLPPEVGDSPRTLFYPGSSIGNLTPDDALTFLRRARISSPGCNLLIGVDLVKASELLESAYDDALGVTAAFNLNVLLHVNALIGSDFDVRDWRHVAHFNQADSRIEMHLQSRRALAVRWPGGERLFVAGEGIHSENSYKYRADDFDALLRQSGFVRTRRWSDERDWFAVFCAES